MSNEISVQDGLRIRNGSLQYISQPTSFQANMAGQNGPTPGALSVPPTGLDVPLSELTQMGGMVWIMNLGTSVGDADPTHWVNVGVRDVSGNKFWPLFSLLPGEFFRGRLSPELGWDEPGTGTGTGSATSFLHLRSNVGTLRCRVDAFDP